MSQAQRLGLGLADPERENALLVGIIEAISAGPQLGPLASKVARLIVEATATDVCFLHMLDDSGGSLTLTGATPPFDTQVGRIQLPLGEGISGWVASHRKPAVITEDKEADPRYRYFPELGGHDYTSMASVPMAASPGGLVGVLNVHTRERRAFSDRDVRLLTSIGSLVAGAMHQGRLHRQLAARERAAGRFAEQVIAAQEAERGRLARDIHDGIMQRLVSVTYHLDAAVDAVSGFSPFGVEQLESARRLADLTLDEGRAAIAGLRPPVLDDLGLADGLASLARSIGQIEVRVDVPECRAVRARGDRPVPDRAGIPAEHRQARQGDHRPRPAALRCRARRAAGHRQRLRLLPGRQARGQPGGQPRRRRRPAR